VENIPSEKSVSVNAARNFTKSDDDLFNSVWNYR